MWEKITEFLVVALAFVSAPFVTPKPPVVVEQPPIVIEESVQPEVVPVVESEPKPTEPVVEVTPAKVVKTVDPYCAQYAFRYSAEKYKSESERPDEVRKDCSKENKGSGDDSIEELSDENKDCSDKVKDAEKELKAWKKKYDEYKARCPKGAETFSVSSITSLSQETDVQKDETTDQDLKSCFTIDKLVKYAEGIYYRQSFALNGSCSKNAATFAWYLDGIKVGTSSKLAVPLSSKFNGFKGFRNYVPFEIKLIVTASDGATKSESKTISFREIPGVEPCITPSSSKTKELELNSEIEFDASCTKYTDENPVVKYSWIFRDGKEGESKSGKKVSHSFTKGATTVTFSQCGGEGKALEVELQLETKLGNSNNALFHYCIKK